MTANSDAPLIEAQTLYRRFGVVTAVNGLSLAVDRGEIVGFLGPNGAGKTTTLRMLAGYLPPDAGRVSLGGIDMWTRPQEARRHLGYLPEGAPLYREMTPLSLLRFIAGIRGLSRRLWRQRRDFVIDALMLEPVLYSRIENLSKGYRRRVAFAVALLSDPEILILDEPTDGLDPNQKRDVRALLRSLASEKAILLSTHLLEEVDTVCDRALIVDRGRIVAAGSSADFRARAPAAGTLVLHVPPADAERAEKCLAAASIIATPDPLNRGWITLSPKRQPGGRDGVGPADSDLLRNTASANLVRAGIRVLSLATISNPLDAVFQAVTRPGQRQEIGR